MSDVQNQISSIVRSMAQLDHDPDPGANLISEAGIDSLMALRILASIEKSFEVRIPDDQLMEMTSVEKIAHFIESARRA